MLSHLDENGFDHPARTQHCFHCDEPVFQYLTGTVLKSHRMLQLQHYVMISHGSVPSLKLGPRDLLTHVPRQSNIVFCLDCLKGELSTKYPQGSVDELCTGCQQSVDKSDSYTQAEVVDRLTGDIFKYRGKIFLHSECLSDHFDKIHEKRTV